jgi:WD40 repeat protein
MSRIIISRHIILIFHFSLFILHCSFLFAQKPEMGLPIGHRYSVTDVCFSPDGWHALSGSSDFTIILWDINTGKRIRSFMGHNSCVHSVCFSHDGQKAISGSSDKTLKLWDVPTGKEIRSFIGHTAWIFSVCFKMV